MVPENHFYTGPFGPSSLRLSLLPSLTSEFYDFLAMRDPQNHGFQYYDGVILDFGGALILGNFHLWILVPQKFPLFLFSCKNHVHHASTRVICCLVSEIAEGCFLDYSGNTVHDILAADRP